MIYTTRANMYVINYNYIDNIKFNLSAKLISFHGICPNNEIIKRVSLFYRD